MRLRLAVCAVLALSAIAVAGAGWLAEVPEITAAEAVEATEAALDGAGLSADVDAEAFADVYATRTRRTVDVWRVRATVRDAPIDVLLTRTGARPVSIDDRSPNGTTYVLSELEYGAVASRVADPALARLVRRNITLTLAAVLVVAMAIALAFVTQPEELR